MESFANKLFEMAEPYLCVRDDLLHTRVAHAYALELMAAEGGDGRIVEPAIILHDVGWSRVEPGDIPQAFGFRLSLGKVDPTNRIHEIEGARIARELLEKLAYDPERIERIAHIIERHDSGKEPASIEEAVVKDSDRLWRVSRPGFDKEIVRQKLSPAEVWGFLVECYRSYFFTTT